MKRGIKTVVGVILLMVPFFSGCAMHRDMVDIQERMIAVERLNKDLQSQNSALKSQLQNELDTLDRSNQSSEKNLRTQYASMNVNFDTMSQELRLLGGRIEEVEYKIDRKMTDGDARNMKQQERLDEVSIEIQKIDQRVAAIERYLGLDRKTTKNEIPSAAPQPVVPDSAPTDFYADGKAAFDKGEWDKARGLFGELLKNDPTSANADNAQFWIGETYYNEQWFEKAILEYQTVIEQYPKGNKVPAAMLKQGLAFLKLGDQSNARLVLKRLIQYYPKSNEASIATAKLKDI